MGKTYDAITADLQSWMMRQHIFFVATAPASANGYINCSPKGMDTFRILGSREIAYLDLTGSGVETIAPLKENGRIVIMFCGFEGPPQIVRLHGAGMVYPLGSEGFENYGEAFKALPGARSIIHVQVTRISDSCGYGVPLYDFKGQRDTLTTWARNKGPEGLITYRREKNAVSLDGLSGL